MSDINIGVDWAQGDDKTCVVFIRSDGDGTFTVIGELFGEVAEFVAALETADADLLEALENLSGAVHAVGYDTVSIIHPALLNANEAIRKHTKENDNG